MIFKAIKFVADAHDGHNRKGTTIPYISHLMNVMKILSENDCENEVIVAGILHDVVEDTPVSLEEVERLFNKRVASIVEGVSEPAELKKNSQPEKTWRDRKQHTLHFLNVVDDVGILLVACADKLDNTRAILHDLESKGESIWERFNAGKEDQKWYYESLAKVLLNRGTKFGGPLLQLATQLDHTVKQIFIRSIPEYNEPLNL